MRSEAVQDGDIFDDLENGNMNAASVALRMAVKYRRFMTDAKINRRGPLARLEKAHTVFKVGHDGEKKKLASQARRTLLRQTTQIRAM
jgi:hypothetical protein